MYENRGTFSKKKKKYYYSVVFSYNLHMSVRLRVNHGRKIKPELTFYVQQTPDFMELD